MDSGTHFREGCGEGASAGCRLPNWGMGRDEKKYKGRKGVGGNKVSEGMEKYEKGW